MNIKNILTTVLVSAITTFGVIWGYGKYAANQSKVAGQDPSVLPANYRYTGGNDGGFGPNPPTDFTMAAQSAIPTVVHIKTKTKARQVNNNLPRMQSPFGDIFGDDIMDQLFRGYQPEQRASGSGVIISDDGYIVTNNHVVAGADELTVTLSNRKIYTAKVIGAEPAYDLALIKIEAKGLPYLVYGNSDNVKIGQWVLAIGYPFNLETTVTAGIVSAKGRTAGLNKDRPGSRASGVESYIQTDAAVNPGNSGGALIDTDGKLIGINSAIASPTGTYSGYSYAIPVSIVSKVIDDIIKFGTVQRAFLGVTYAPEEATAEQKKANGIPEYVQGVYVTDASTNGAAYAAGIRKGDVITKINSTTINSSAEMQEQISRYKPGDKVSVSYTRNGQEVTANVTLKNQAGNFDVVKAQTSMERLGAELVNFDPKKAKDYELEGGVVVKSIDRNGAIGQTRIRENFVIIKANDRVIKNVDDLKAVLSTEKSVTLSGFYPGLDGLYEYNVNLNE